MNQVRKMIVVLVALSVMMGGCAHLKGGMGPGSEDALRQRVNQEWNAKLNSDWGVVYDLTVASFKKKVSRPIFLKGANLDISEFSIKEIEILESGKDAVVTVESKTSHMNMTFPFTFKETWVLEDKEWRLKLVPVGIPGVGN